jgi:hypothetical protein
MAPIGCTKTSVRNYHCSLSNNTEKRISQEITNNFLKILCKYIAECTQVRTKILTRVLSILFEHSH